MPEGNPVIENGAQFGAKVEENMRSTQAANDALKEAVVGTDLMNQSLGSLVETMHKSKYSFQSFMSELEKTNVVLHTAAKSATDLSVGMKSATASVEGLLSAFTNLSQRTMPEIIHSIGMASSGYKKQLEGLREQREEGMSNYNASKKRVEGIKDETESMKKNLGVQYEISDSAQMLKKDLAEAEAGMKKASSALDKTNEEFEETSEQAESLSKVLTKTVGWITLIAGAVVTLAMAYDNAITAKREVIYTLGRMGASYRQNNIEMESFNKGFTQIANKWGMLREEMAKAVAPLAGLGVGIGVGGIKESFDKVKATMFEASEWMGGMYRAQGVDMGITSKALGTLSTTFDMSGKNLSNTFANIYTQGEKSVMGMQQYINQMTSMVEMTRRFGASEEGAMIMLNVFGEELKKGTITLDSLAKITTPAMWSTEQQGAVVTLMKQLAPKEAAKLGITGKNVMDDILNLQMKATEDSSVVALGIMTMVKQLIPETASNGEKAIMTQKILQQLTGATIDRLDVLANYSDPKKLSEMIEKAMEDPKTPKEIMNEFGESYIKTFKESLVDKVDQLRDGIIGIKDFMVIKWGSTGKIETTGYGREKQYEELREAKRAGLVKSEEENLYGKTITNLYSGVKSGSEASLSPEQGQFLKEVGERLKGEKDKKVLKKQTGGYISETAQYMLEAGEQVKRPGEGGGGDMSISLGGLNVTIGDRGDIRGQLTEAFDKMKQETIKELQYQWDEAGVT